MKKDNFPFLQIPRALPREVPVQIRVLGYKEIHGEYSEGDAADQSARCIDCGNPYCSWGCPLHNRIPQWLKLVQQGRIEDAATLMHETNPLPEICGRICPQDRLCEGDCTLETGFDAVTIGAVERWATDEALRRGWRPSTSSEPTGKRVAIVGAGPAGLSVADRMARAGVSAHVFDRYEEIGGLLTFGIPPFKLDKAVIRTRRDVLEGMGVRFHLNTDVGRDVAFSTLLNDYDAVFVGTGAYTAVDAKLPGRDIAGVHAALPFLISNARRILGTADASDMPNLIGKRVVILGGGDTAMDCVRTAIRMDAERVTCVYRRDEQNMPGSRREVKYSRDEGVEFLFNRQPLEILGDADGVRAICVGETTLIADALGRAHPKLVPDSEKDIPADIVIQSFGFLASPPQWCDEFGIERDAAGKLIVGAPGKLPLQTSNPKVFAGGDAIRGADLVVRAVYDGREAAKSMLQVMGVAGAVVAA